MDSPTRVNPTHRHVSLLTRILTRSVRIRASHTKFSLVGKGGAAKAASVVLVCPEGMLHPGLANLLKAIVVARSAAHPIEILRYDRMVWIRQLIKMHGLISVVARGRSDPQADLACATAKLLLIQSYLPR